MASIEAKQICFKDAKERQKFESLTIRARNVLYRNNKEYLAEGEPVATFIGEYLNGGSTNGPFLEHVTRLLEKHSDDYKELNKEDKEIMRLMVADFTGGQIAAPRELTYRILS